MNAATIDTPTVQQYAELQDAFAFFNLRLFGGRLPSAMTVLTSNPRSRGHFANNRWGEGLRCDRAETHEISLNPELFAVQDVRVTLSTLVHEMVHLQQQIEGKPSRSGYHNKQWANMMAEVGLVASDTGRPGGKQVGQRMTHYIEAGGAFDGACQELLDEGWQFPLARVAEVRGGAARKPTRVKFTCAECGAAAWGKPSLNIMCGDCDVVMEAEQG